ncbi:amidohydrolase [Reyranella sp.]|uniref:amidohydrolase n=1 Tax=Reyranella sp. TaxID=1929291 RepID=UPI003BAC6AAB
MTSADIIFVGKNIVTMTEAAPSARALAVLDGRILAVGEEAAVMAARGPDTRVVDLGSRALLPGFMDGHSHFINAVRFSTWANVSSPPVGKAEDIAGVVRLLEEHRQKRGLRPGEWLMAYGYDGTTLTDGRELTRADLDPHFPDNPVLILHVSLHGAVLNTAGFKAVGFDLLAPTPPGGMTARLPDGKEAAGLVMEHSFIPIYLKMPTATEDEQLEGFAAAQAHYAANGYTTTQDAPMEPATRPLYHRAAREGRLVIDIVGYVNWLEFPQILEKHAEPFGQGYDRRFRIGGVKIVADGSPQGKTAFWSRPLLTPGPGGETDWHGEPNVTPEDLDRLVKLAYDNGIQVLTHCNGDAAIEMMLEAHEKAGAPQGRRTVIVHSQFVRPDQLERYVRYGMLPSFFTNHTFFWGDVHVENLGRERAFFLSPARTARAMGIRFTNHSDFAVTPLDPMFILWTSVNRVSRSGTIIGPDERLTVWDGLRALTIDAAFQYGEEREKGSLEAGKLADLVVLDANPLEVPAANLKDIRILETFKEGRSIHRAADS